MQFSNAELKRVKKLASQMETFSLGGGSLAALLYRLDRAERLTDYAACRCISLDQCKCGFLKNYVRWKKSSGKAR